jgi:CRISPR system Cascade subunit CasA
VLDPANSGLPDDLWRSIWLNILERPLLQNLAGDYESSDPDNIFPWLTHTRTSEKKTGLDTTPIDAHPLQMYWSMPRRIRVNWGDIKSGSCDLCGEESDQLVTKYITQNYGTNYTGAWQHPLSPHQVSKEGEALPRHAQPGGINYRHWLGLTSGSESNIPALVVKVFIKGRKLKSEHLRLHAFGYDMDNMKARCWYETTFPLFSIDEEIRDEFDKRVATLVDAASNTANMLRSCIKEAWFKRPGDARGGTAFLVEAFLNHTENAFFAQLKQLIGQLEAGEDGRASLYTWHKILSGAALELFDYWTDRGNFEAVNPRRIAEARRKLSGWLYSKNKGLPKLMEITLDKEKAT